MALELQLLIIAVGVVACLGFAYALMRLAAGADAHLERLTPAVRERLLQSARNARQLPRLPGGPARPAGQL